MIILLLLIVISPGPPWKPPLVSGASWLNIIIIIINWKILQIWTAKAGELELARGFKPIRNGEIFWINNNCRNRAVANYNKKGVKLE